MEVLSFPRSSLPAVAEQVIEVPALSLPVCAVQRVVPLEPQMAEPIEEVPTALSVAVLQQQTVVQAVDIPVPHRGGGRRRLQGSLPEQDPTASGAEIADIPVRGGQQDFHLGQGSIASSSPAADEAFAGGFSTFPWDKKVRVSPRVRVRGCPSTSAHGLWRLVGRPSVPSSGSNSSRGARPTIGTDVPTRPYGTLLRASRLSGSARSLQTVGSGTGIGILVSVLGVLPPLPLARHPLTPSWVRRASLTKAACTRLVLLVSSTSPGPDAWRHGRFGPEGQLCSVLVLLVTILLVLCCLLLTTGPRCSTSWPLWTRRTVTSLLVACFAGFAGDSAHRAVLLSLSSASRCPASWPVWIRRTGVSSRSSTFLSWRRGFSHGPDVLWTRWPMPLLCLCSLRLWQAPVCRVHGRCGRARRRLGSGMAIAGMLVTMLSRCVHLVVGRPVESPQVQFVDTIMGMPVVVQRQVLRSRQCLLSGGGRRCVVPATSSSCWS